MSAQERQRPPAGHGELLCTPPFGEWEALAGRNAAAVGTWPVALQELRRTAREQTIAEAERFSSTIGIKTARPSEDLIVMTGHQPELYHPGVWVKDFLVQRLADEMGAFGLDIVVDTDACEGIALRAPCLGPVVQVCEIPLVASGGGAYVQAAPPGPSEIAEFREAGLAVLASLSAPALSRQFALFCDALAASAGTAPDVGTLMTAARRRYEASAGTDYAEIQASAQARTSAYLRFAAGILLDGQRFRDVTNRALAAYRELTGTRSVTHPFPDLGETEGRTEAPFWLLDAGRRLPVSVDPDAVLYAADTAVVGLGGTIDEAVDALAGAGCVLAPRALTLTMFQRLFVADLFVHGTGGGRYDRVTDAVISAYYGVEPPAFVVASLTLLLPLNAPLVTDEDVRALEARMHRLVHNPDEAIAEVAFETDAQRTRAEALVSQKAALVAAIAAPDADRKAVGASIRAVNEALLELLGLATDELRDAVERTRVERDASAVLADRTYPYCLWDPREVMEAVR